MKKQDIIAIAVLTVVGAVLGILLLSTLFSSPGEEFTKSIPPEPVQAGFNEAGKEYLLHQEIQDFTVTVDGVEAPKNSTPFGS